MSHYVVGISGGIGSGKTTVTDLFAEHGVEVIDADVIARQVVEPGSEALKAIVDKFGPAILTATGHLDRSKLRALAFENPENTTWLNKLLHPLIRQKMLADTRQASSPYCLLSVPLLVENNLSQMVDSVLIVDVNEEVQLQRAMLRDNSDKQQIRAIMHAQASREERLAIADDVIDNNAEQSQLTVQVEKLHGQYIALAQEKADKNR